MSHGHTPLFILPLEQGGEGAPEQEEHCGESVFFSFFLKAAIPSATRFLSEGKSFKEKLPIVPPCAVPILFR
jgi:hypothetical protein